MSTVIETILMNGAVLVLSTASALGLGQLLLSGVSQMSFRVNSMNAKDCAGMPSAKSAPSVAKTNRL